jgi:hypothetical protein
VARPHRCRDAMDAGGDTGRHGRRFQFRLRHGLVSRVDDRGLRPGPGLARVVVAPAWMRDRAGAVSGRVAGRRDDPRDAGIPAPGIRR